MAHTDKLLNLIGDFPGAFDDPDTKGSSEDQDAQENAEDEATASAEPNPALEQTSSPDSAGIPEAWDSIAAQLSALELSPPVSEPIPESEPPRTEQARGAEQRDSTLEKVVVNTRDPSEEASSGTDTGLGEQPFRSEETNATVMPPSAESSPESMPLEQPIPPIEAATAEASSPLEIRSPVAKEIGAVAHGVESQQAFSVAGRVSDVSEALVDNSPESGATETIEPSNRVADADQVKSESVTIAGEEMAGEEIVPAEPADYTQALRRRLSTLTWGEIEIYLTYGARGLQSVWITVGKSGTEVQSLCEAIARLVNLLLVNQFPVADIVQQLRGIRGADAEGLGPNRILGLADLIGKVVQEAPTTLPQLSDQTDSTYYRSLEESSPVGIEAEHASQPAEFTGDSTTGISQAETTTEGNSTAGGPPQQAVWTSLPQDTHSAGLCPACGAELQIMNGCTGGACMVCGYSSCS